MHAFRKKISLFLHRETSSSSSERKTWHNGRLHREMHFRSRGSSNRENER